MKPINIIYGIVGVLMALTGACLTLQAFSFLAFAPHSNASFVFCLLGLAGGYLFVRGLLGVRRNFDFRYRESVRDTQASQPTVEDRLDELERLKRRAMVTPEEYEAKRKDILNDL